MPSDFITVKALCDELNEMLSGGRISKVCMPEKDEITLLIRVGGDNKLLVISVSPQNPRIHLTDVRKENPTTAPNMCMYLRKYLGGGVIKSVKMLGEDRIIAIDVESRNEMRDSVNYTLIAEMMGRYSNLIAISEGGIIGAALKQVPFDSATKRCILAGTRYTLPAQSKILPSDVSAITDYLCAYDGGGLAKYFVGGCAGYSLATAKYLLSLAGVDDNSSKLNKTSIDNIVRTSQLLLNVYKSDLYKPCCLSKEGEIQDYYISHYSESDEYIDFPTLNSAIDYCTTQKDRIERQREHTGAISKRYRAFVTKTQKKLAKCYERIKECENAEYYKKCGEFITVNFHNIKKGDISVTAYDYYQEDCPEISIPIEHTLSPQQNAQNYYKKYAKLKRTHTAVTAQIEELTLLLDYLGSIGNAINVCSTPAEIKDIQSELERIGAYRTSSKRVLDKKSKPSLPLCYTIEGYKVSVGKNNVQNDRLTFKTADGGDIWLHVKDAHGSHVIIFCGKDTPPESVITSACEIAAYYSQSRDADKVTVDYTRRKFVKRHPCGNLGMVTYTDYSSVNVKPCSHFELLN